MGWGHHLLATLSRLKLFEVFLGSESCGMSSTMYCLLLEVVIELLWTHAARLVAVSRSIFTRQDRPTKVGT